MAKITFSGDIITGKYMGGIVQRNNSGYFWRSISKTKPSLQASQILPRAALKSAASLYRTLPAALKNSWYNTALTFFPRKSGQSGIIYNGANCFIAYNSFVFFALSCGQSTPYYLFNSSYTPLSTLNFEIKTTPPSLLFLRECQDDWLLTPYELLLDSVSWSGGASDEIIFGLMPNIDLQHQLPPYGPRWLDNGSHEWFGYALFCSNVLPAPGAIARTPLQHLVAITRPIYYGAGTVPGGAYYPFFLKVLPQSNFVNSLNSYKSGDVVRYTLFPITQFGRSSGYSTIESVIV